MKNMSEILKIIEGGLKNDPSKVINYCSLLIEKLEKEGDSKNAKRIETVLKRTKSLELTPKNSAFALKTPVDLESRLPLAECKQYDDKDSFITLPKEILEDVEEFINLINNSEDLVGKDIKIFRSLLLYGEPGTGKTQTAKYISAKTNLPLVTIRIDGLVSSYLGSTSKNIKPIKGSSIVVNVQVGPATLQVSFFPTICHGYVVAYVSGPAIGHVEIVVPL